MRNFHWRDWNGPFHVCPPSKLPRYGCAPAPVSATDDCAAFCGPHTSHTICPAVSGTGVASGAPCHVSVSPTGHAPVASGTPGLLPATVWSQIAIVFGPAFALVKIL